MENGKQIEAFGLAIELGAVLESLMDRASQYPGTVSDDAFQLVRRAMALSLCLERELRPAKGASPTWESPDPQGAT